MVVPFLLLTHISVCSAMAKKAADSYCNVVHIYVYTEQPKMIENL